MAVVATADNPSAIYYNPAGLTQLQGHNLRGGVYGLHLGTEYDSPAGGSFDNEEPWHAIPQLFYAYKPENLPLSFGAGIYTPFGLSMKWPQDTGFRTIATEGSLTYLTINPVMAWEIVPGLSVGGGVTLNYSEVDLRQGFTTFPDNDEFRIHGDGTDLGFNLGLLWKISPKVSTGISYRSGTKIDMDGHTHTSMVAPTPFALSSDASADFPFPQKVVVGISYRPTPAWNLEFDVDWTDWDRLDTITVNQATPAPGFPADVPLQLHWQSSCYYEFGVTRYFENDWLVSFGYIFNENSMPDAYYNPIVADLDRHFLSIGAGRRGAHLDFDISYQFGYGPKRTVTGSATSPAGQTADGDYEFISHAVGITVGWRF
jgi:long-chain fatty acid transport protein